MTFSDVHHVEFVMGMAISIDLRTADGSEAALSAIVEWLHRVDMMFSTYRDESPVSAFGRGELPRAEVADDLAEILDLCDDLYRMTGGSFDAWAVPAPNGTRFDPSGVVKGWALERAAVLAESFGVENFCINGGGDVVLRGHPSPGDSWLVGIRHPFDDKSVATVVAAEGRLAVATSASYERGGHIIDPTTGMPAALLASATVVGPDLALADAFATAAFVMGPAATEWIADQSGYDAYLITNDGHTSWSIGFARYRVDEPERRRT